MAQIISQREFRNDSGAIMKRVEEGESFVITSNGRTIAELR
ncbi:MAG: type II toxin-antitoxin system Phd/YefM family antitoxin, partial [Actinomycetota bacterium]